MIEVSERLYVGNQNDYENTVKLQGDAWHVVHACKEPYHRQALGYTGRSAPKDHKEYLIALRDYRLILNLIDPDNPAYVPKEIIDAALEFIHEGLSLDKKVLVHCNLGKSRSPSIAMLYLATQSKIPSASLLEAEAAFKKLYSQYMPGAGMRGFMQQHWDIYCKK